MRGVCEGAWECQSVCTNLPTLFNSARVVFHLMCVALDVRGVVYVVCVVCVVCGDALPPPAVPQHLT